MITQTNNSQETRLRSRKFLLAAFVEAFASACCALLVVLNLTDVEAVLPVLYWWASVSGGVLALYGGSNVAATLASRGEE